MFESAFALEAPGRRSPLLISLTVQAAAVATVLLLPLYYVEQLTVLPTLPVPTYAPRLPHIKIVAVIRETAAALVPRLTPPLLTAPSRINPLNTRPVQLTDAGAPPLILDGAVFTDSFATPLVGPPRLAAAPPPEPAKAPAPKPAPTSGPVRIGGTVQAAKLIHQVRPLYPALAKQVRIQGSVQLQAVIARDGTIQNLQLVSGHPLLVPAAMEAVRQWRYSPTTLNGETVEVLTQIDVHFKLN